MNIHLWRRLFMAALMMLSSVLGAFILLLVYWFGVLSWEQFQALRLATVPMWLILVALVVGISLVSSIIVTIYLSEPYEWVRAKLNWLLLGKYKHPIFDQKTRRHGWYDDNQVIDEDINRVRDKLVQLSKDIQQFATIPSFVGTETKEEIIEVERHRIARELHDSVSQQLFAATMMLSAIKDQQQIVLPDLLQQQIMRVDHVIATAQVEMRALLLHLRPLGLEDRSLKQGITQLLLELQTKIPTNLYWELAEVNLDSGIEAHLFRVIQEALSNTLRHAKAQRLEVYLQEDQSSIQLKIIDDGVGFDVSQSDKLGSYGLRNIRERVNSLGGDCKIVSIIDKGTVIEINLPKGESI